MELKQTEIDFITAWLAVEEAKIAFENLTKATEAAVKEHGLGHMFQDPLTGCVFKLVEPDGRWVRDKLGHVRTRRNGEKSGTLFLTEAMAAGYEVN